MKAILPVDMQSFVEGSSLRVGIYLLEPIKPSSSLSKMLGVAGCEGSSGMNIGGLKVHTGDIIFCRGSDTFGVFKVIGCAAAPDFPPHVVGLKHSRLSESTWLLHNDDAVAISHEDILAVAVWAPIGGSRICALVPPAVAYYHPDTV